jgi:hypothetical protein
VIEYGFATYKFVKLDKFPIESGIDPARLLLDSPLCMLLVAGDVCNQCVSVGTTTQVDTNP